MFGQSALTELATATDGTTSMRIEMKEGLDELTKAIRGKGLTLGTDGGSVWAKMGDVKVG